jgi:hypothetical protein
MRIRFAIIFLMPLAATAGAAAVELPPEQVEFFESRIRPVLAQDCYECHRSGEKVRGGLALDSRDGLLAGGDSGAVVVPGDPAGSLLLKMIRHDVDDESLKMPKAGAQLESEVLADFEKWIAMGAPDPRDQPVSDEQVEADTDWQAVLERRKSWWSFQPVADPPVPEVKDAQWSANAVDRFIKAKIDGEKLDPVGLASAEVLVRRLYFTLLGLPPTVAEVDEFVFAHNKDAEAATVALVDRLLADSRFGERWARHWMDWVRYAETHGSEGDPAIPHAWRYRDYLVRALNADVPYDQLLREHVAGDVLPAPRVNEELGLNESAIGAAQWRFVLHGFAPTDAHDELVRFTDDQINTFTKAFLGLTVSCARCHDHKFDAISQTDFYALFGILKTCRPGLVAADAPGLLEKNRAELMEQKAQLRRKLGELWSDSAQDAALARRLITHEPGTTLVKDGLRELLTSLPRDGDEFSWAWKKREEKLQAEIAQLREFRAATDGVLQRWDFSDPAVAETWFAEGEGLLDAVSAAGEFSVSSGANDDERIVRGVYPAGVYSHTLSDKHRAVFHSPGVHLDGEHELWLRVVGEGQSLVRYVVRNYPRSGTVYPVLNLGGEDWQWKNWSLKYWDGDRIHVELSTAADSAVLAKTGNERSWFGVREVVVRRRGEGADAPGPPAAAREYLFPLVAALKGRTFSHPEQIGAAVSDLLAELAGRWGRGGSISDAEALLLDQCLREDLLSNRVSELGEGKALLTQYRTLEAEVPVATRVPGVLESQGENQALFVRGDHRSPGDDVPRRLLDALGGEAYDTGQSGRLELAEDLVAADNPFTARVIVNRVWHYLFGSGLVRTTDNFGRLGEEPSHPELLDHLAARFVAGGWSMKKLIRELMLTRTWQLDSTPSTIAQTQDPENRLLSHANLRRLEAEAIRDTLLSVSGDLDATKFGEPVDGNSKRRSVYIRQRRNNLDQFLAAFDAPVPTATKGRRDVTNVPAQSLAMLNGDFARARAASWGRAAELSKEQPDQLVERLFREALGRGPTEAEAAGALSLVEELRRDADRVQQELEKLTGTLERQRQEIREIIDPVRARLLAEAQEEPSADGGDIDPVEAFGAIGQWLFDEDSEDSVGSLHGELRGSARIEDGALVVDGEGFLATAPLVERLEEKTLEVQVQLDGLDQRAGGVMGVQDLHGGLFDSIVWAEKSERRWLAGSNNHKRTLSFGGEEETVADIEPTHLVISYAADGTIRAYRNGALYGEPIRRAPLQPFEAGAAQVIFGLRHGTAASGNRVLKGRIFEARLYDRALDESEISALAAAKGTAGPRVGRKQVLAALSGEQRKALEKLETQSSALEETLRGREKQAGTQSPWAGLAHAVFNLKEFVYLR